MLFRSLFGTLLFHLFYIIDNWDGEVARFKGLSSEWGGWFDVIADMIVHVTLPIGVAIGLIQQRAPSWVMALGYCAAFGIAVDFVVTMWAKARGFGPAVREEIVPPSTWFQANLTNENFSLVVMAFFLLNGRLAFLLLLAVGCQIFWISYLWRERRRLFC